MGSNKRLPNNWAHSAASLKEGRTEFMIQCPFCLPEVRILQAFVRISHQSTHTCAPTHVQLPHTNLTAHNRTCFFFLHFFHGCQPMENKWWWVFWVCKKFGCVWVNLLKLENISENLLMLATAVPVCPKYDLERRVQNCEARPVKFIPDILSQPHFPPLLFDKSSHLLDPI